MAPATAPGRFLSRLLGDRSGATAAMFGVLLVPLLLSIGVAVDGARAYMVKARLSHALDAAGLAVGASDGTEAQLRQVMRNFFEANFPPEVLGAAAEPSVVIADKVITLTATADLTPSFMRLFGYDSLTVSAMTEVTQETKGLEVVLVLDNTGSMRGSKIAALRQASLDLVDILFGDADENDNLKVGIVPYSAAVNVGSGGKTAG
ncbi:MAG: TadE/TadG family type IV pilus assembly protein, partial [Acetobacterales bacterium]